MLGIQPCGIHKKVEPFVKKYGRFGSSDGAALSGDGAAPPTHSNGQAPLRPADAQAGTTPITLRRPAKISTVSHTLDAEVAERLRHFAFRERISESAVIEYALRGLFIEGDDAELGQRLREAGAALRRRSLA